MADAEGATAEAPKAEPDAPAEPTAEPTGEPTAEPTAEPTGEPTAEPTAEPAEPAEPTAPSAADASPGDPADAPAAPAADGGTAGPEAVPTDSTVGAKTPAATEGAEVTTLRPPVVYIEAAEGQTRVVLLQDKGDRISVRDVGSSLSPMKDLGVGRDGEEASALLQRRSDFAALLGSILKPAAEVVQGHNTEVVLGLSQWYSDLPQEDKASFEGVWDSMRQQVKENLAEDAVLVVLPLSNDEQARHEHRAVAFATTQVQRLKPDFSGIVLDTSEPSSSELLCTCGSAADSPVLRIPLSLEDGRQLIEGGDDGASKWESQCQEKCKEVFTASKDVLAGRCANASPPQVCALAGLVRGISAPLGLQELEAAPGKLKESLVAAMPAVEQASVLRTAAALEILSSTLESSVQILFVETFEIGGSSFTASWSVGHYLKRPQGRKEVKADSAASEETKPLEKGPSTESTEKEEDATADGGEAAQVEEKPMDPKPPSQQSGEPTKLRPGPGFVVYIIAPNEDVPLSGADFSALRSAAVQSDATVLLSARSASSLVAEEGKKVSESNRVLRPLADFAVRRFSPAGSSKAGSHQSAFQHLFEAIVPHGTEAVYRNVLEGIQNLGFPGDAAAAAEALLPVGVSKVTKQEFCDSLADAFVHPEMLVVCPKSKAVADWPEVRTVHFLGEDVTGEAALKIKVAEAWKAAGHGGHGVILVLAARGRCNMAPGEYERQMRQELRFAMEGLPSRWPLLWAPGPAEVGLFPVGCKQRSNWAMQQSYLAELPGWLRYLLLIRPS